MDNLKITVYQGYLFWENTDKNLQNISLRLSGIREKTNLIILPEMFNTGFTMNAEALGETMDGKTMQWMQKTAQKYDAVVTGSLIIKEGGKFYNRLFGYAPMVRMSITISATFLLWAKKIRFIPQALKN
jgi:omega-amidase